MSVMMVVTDEWRERITLELWCEDEMMTESEREMSKVRRMELWDREWV